MTWSSVLEFLKLPFITNFLNWIMNSLSKKKTNSITESNIFLHPIFSRLKSWRNDNVMRLKFSTEYRTIIFQKYLSLFLECHENEIKTFIEKKEFQKMDGAQLLSVVSDLITEINSQHEVKMVDFGIPYVVIERMRKYNTSKTSLVHDHFRSIFENNFYESENNFLRIYTALNLITLLIQIALVNSEIVFNSIGEELSGRTIIHMGREFREP